MKLEVKITKRLKNFVLDDFIHEQGVLVFRSWAAARA